MNKNISTAGVGMYATMLVALLHTMGVDADEGMVTEAIMGAIAIVTFATWIYGQLSRKDLSLGIFRR
jgi:hypothetical protein